MKKSSHVKNVQKTIRAGLRENKEELKTLRAALRALDGKATPGRRPRGK